MEQLLVRFRPHRGVTPHAPEDHRVPPQEVCRQSGVQLPT